MTRNINSIKLDFICKVYIMLFVFIGSAFSFAAEEEQHLDKRAELIGSLYSVVGVFAVLLGLGLIIISIMKLKRRAENPNDPKSFPSSILITMLAGALILNFSGTSSTLIATLLGNQAGHCFVLQEQLMEHDKGTIQMGDLHQENCWDSSKSKAVDDIAKKVDEMSDGNGSLLKKNIEIIVGLFQLAGLIYLIKGIYGLKLVSEGVSREGYGKQILTMITAALVIDLPHTLEMLDETIKLLGFGG
ncbi:hypothetical protein AB6C47_018290 [Vibrio cyclitrophicus]